MDILILGYGAMGRAMAAAWPHHRIHAVNSENDSLDTSLMYDVVVLAVKPQVLPSVLGHYVDALKDRVRHGWITVAAGHPLSFYRTLIPLPMPIVRTMPNLAVSLREGMTLGYSDQVIPQPLEELLWETGDFICFEEESLIDRATGLSGSGPAYVYLLIEALTEAGLSLGLERSVAERLTRQMVIGTGVLLKESPLPPQELRERVTSPAGATAAALAVFHREGFFPLCEKAVRACYARALALGEEEPDRGS